MCPSVSVLMFPLILFPDSTLRFHIAASPVGNVWTDMFLEVFKRGSESQAHEWWQRVVIHDKMFLSAKLITWNKMWRRLCHWQLCGPQYISMREHDLQPPPFCQSLEATRGFLSLTARGSRSIVLCTSGEGESHSHVERMRWLALRNFLKAWRFLPAIVNFGNID